MENYRLVSLTLQNTNMEIYLLNFIEKSYDDEWLKSGVKDRERRQELPLFFGNVRRREFWKEFSKVAFADWNEQKQKSINFEVLNPNVQDHIEAVDSTAQTYDQRATNNCNSFVDETKSEVLNHTLKKEKPQKVCQLLVDKTIENSCKKYTDQMDKFANKKLFEDKELEMAHLEIKNKIILEISKEEIFQNFELSQWTTVVEQLGTQIDGKFLKHKILYTEKEMALRKRVQRSMDYFEEVYNDNMKTTIEKGSNSKENFQKIQERYSKQAKFQFEENLGNFLVEIPHKILDDFDAKIGNQMKNFEIENENIHGKSLQNFVLPLMFGLYQAIYLMPKFYLYYLKEYKNEETRGSAHHNYILVLIIGIGLIMKIYKYITK